MSSSDDSDSQDLDHSYRDSISMSSRGCQDSRSESSSRTQQQEPVILSRLPRGAIPLTSNPPECGSCKSQKSHYHQTPEKLSKPKPRRRTERRVEESSYVSYKNVFRIHLESVYDVFTPKSSNAPRVRFVFIRTPENVVYMQWEEFSFTIGASGINGVNLNQEYDALPISDILLDCPIIYNGIRRPTTLSIDPNSGQPFRFNFFYDGSADQVNERVRVTFPASCVSWITEK